MRQREFAHQSFPHSFWNSRSPMLCRYVLSMTLLSPGAGRVSYRRELAWFFSSFWRSNSSSRSDTCATGGGVRQRGRKECDTAGEARFPESDNFDRSEDTVHSTVACPDHQENPQRAAPNLTQELEATLRGFFKCRLAVRCLASVSRFFFLATRWKT